MINKHALFKNVAISIPHAGTQIPLEIQAGRLTPDFQRLSTETSDHFTDRLYDFADILGCASISTKTLSLLVNVNRHPKHLKDSVPLAYDDTPIYKEGENPDAKLREKLLRLYHFPYHRRLSRITKIFILDGHSTTRQHHDGTGIAGDFDIIINDRQYSPLDPPEGIRSAPEGYLETYIAELERRLPRSIKIRGNAKYMNTYGHIMAKHGWNGITEMRNRAPLLLQETDESLYMKDGSFLIRESEELRRIFAEAIGATVIKMSKMYFR